MENENIFEKVKSLGLKLGEYVVISGGVLEAHGIRKAGDCDLVVTEEVYERLANDGWEIVFTNDKFILTKDAFEVATDSSFNNYSPDTKKLILEADVINGCAFAKIEETLKFKNELGREKDKKDVEMIEEYLKNNPTEHRNQL